MLNELNVITIGIWKYIKVQDGRQNIEILLYVFNIAKIIGQFHFNFNRCHMYIFMIIDARELS